MYKITTSVPICPVPPPDPEPEVAANALAGETGNIVHTVPKEPPSPADLPRKICLDYSVYMEKPENPRTPETNRPQQLMRRKNGYSVFISMLKLTIYLVYHRLESEKSKAIAYTLISFESTILVCNLYTYAHLWTLTSWKMVETDVVYKMKHMAEDYTRNAETLFYFYIAVNRYSLPIGWALFAAMFAAALMQGLQWSLKNTWEFERNRAHAEIFKEKFPNADVNGKTSAAAVPQPANPPPAAPQPDDETEGDPRFAYENRRPIPLPEIIAMQADRVRRQVRLHQAVLAAEPLPNFRHRTPMDFGDIIKMNGGRVNPSLI
ncbi:unnamed protein product [Caenorhabditis sp. 36 PRJEB53466]|nr:unnamed protein product [Caenorhabditis sp. 36 PRJEB53466]